MEQRNRKRRQGPPLALLLIPLLSVLSISGRATAQTKPTEAPFPTFSQASDAGSVPVAEATGAGVPAPEKPTAQATAAAARPATTAAPISTAPVTPPDAGTPPPKPRKCNWEWNRDGFYMRLLNGLGFVGLSGHGPSGSAHISGLGTGSILAMGGSFKPGLVLAGTVHATEVTARFNGGPYANATFVSNDEAVTVNQNAKAGSAQIGLLLDWYPMKAEGLHVGVGAGLAFVSLVNEADNSTMSGASLGGTLLVGYDWPIAPTWAFGLAAVASVARAPSLKQQKSGDNSGYELRPASIGLSGSILYY